MFANRVNKALKNSSTEKSAVKFNNRSPTLNGVSKMYVDCRTKWFRNFGENISRSNLEVKQKLQKVTSTDNAQKYIKLLKIILFLRQNVFQHVPL